MNIQQGIAAVVDRRDLSVEEMRDVMMDIMTGKTGEAQIGGFLVGLRMKGETVAEITGAAQVMRELATPVSIGGEHLVDVVGTGGDGASIFNVSTASSFAAAAAGARVAKHGNRSVSSKSGAADLLEAAGVRLDLSAEQVARCVEEVGVGFMFAVNHHSAMKYAIGPRKQLAMRTIFNILGPLTNPAGVPNLLLGVFDRNLLVPMAEVLRELGAKHVLVVHSRDGLDEISIAAETDVAELKGGQITEYKIRPENFGLKSASIHSLVVGDAGQSLAIVRQALSGENEPASDMVALNAGAALYACDLADSLAEGVKLAEDAIGSGLAKSKISELADFTQCLMAGDD